MVLAADANGMGAMRSLHWAGIRTVAVFRDRAQLAYWSRYSVKRVLEPGVDLDEAIRNVLEDLDVGPAVVIPTSDRFATFLAENRDVLPSRYIPCIPSAELVTLFNDKALETRRIASIGVPMPRTVEDLPDDPDALIASLGLPLIIKPRTAEDVIRLRIKTAPVFDRGAAHAFYAAHRGDLGSLIAQELISGDGPVQWDCCCTFDGSHELVSAVSHRKLSTSPPGYGVTCHGRVEANDEVVSLSRRIGRAVGFTGPAGFNFKYDEPTGTYQYLELNPRLAMCNALGTHSGVNCPFEAYRIALGESVEPAVAQPGWEYYDAFGDFYGRYTSNGRSPVAALRALAAVTRTLARGPVCPYWRWSDPMPALVGSVRLLRQVVSSRFRRLARIVTPRHEPSGLDPERVSS